MGPVEPAVALPAAYAGAHGQATGDSKAWLIPPRQVPPGRERDDGHGGVGPFRPA
jgi:hypothetical protein